MTKLTRVAALLLLGGVTVVGVMTYARQNVKLEPEFADPISAAAAIDAPSWVKLLAAEASAKGKTQRLTVSMGCFWRGEAVIGAFHGVVATTPGLLDNREVVDADFDPSVVSYTELLKLILRGGVATQVFARTDQQLVEATSLVDASHVIRSDVAIAPDPAPKHSMRIRSMGGVEMTPIQATRVNAAARLGGDVTEFLSPAQIRAVNSSKDKHFSEVSPEMVSSESCHVGH